jgi:hypothetical protein
MNAATLSLLVIAVVLSGCASEVDKCVAAWEEAVKHVPDDGVTRFDQGTRKLTKSNARFEIRKQCMEAAKGE